MRVLSGVQPTGNVHIGNYLGALRNWVLLQQQNTCLFCVVDLHALTAAMPLPQLQEHSMQAAALYMACGVDPETSIIFPQSANSQHAELMWLLSCETSMGWLNRMTQFKDKTGKNRESAFVGLYTYPLLMAADILLYDTECVPVGEDQKQHVELTRDIAIAVNNRYDKEIFTVPDVYIPKTCARVMSLRDGSKKMSKSDISEYSRINLTDTSDTIRRKIRKAKTDSEPFPQHAEEAENRLEVRNLISLFNVLAENVDVYALYGGQESFQSFKDDLADLCIETLHPIREKFLYIMKDRGVLEGILRNGTEKAKDMGAPVLNRVKQSLKLF